MSNLSPHQPALQRLAEITSAMLESAFGQAMERDDEREFAERAGLVLDLSRSLRLTIALDLRLEAAGRVAEAPTAARPERASRVQTERERERSERETEADDFEMSPHGRVEALEHILARAPALDPDGAVGAQIIQLKAFLAPERTPPEPSPTTPSPAPFAGPDADTGLGRPLNQHERRRLRRASG